MPTRPKVTPGTVSRILWHFTGGPRWSQKHRRQLDRPKASAQAYDNLCSILRSRQVRLGAYRESIRVRLPVHAYGRKVRKVTEVGFQVHEVESEPVCCLSDIPARHLAYHALRYGRFALGFHRDAAVRAGFNPVLYTLQGTDVIRSVYQSFTRISRQSPLDELQKVATRLDDSYAACRKYPNAFLQEQLEEAADAGLIADTSREIAESVRHVNSSLAQLIAFTKTFTEDEFDTVYCEREWRSLGSFSFSYSDLAVVALPRQVGTVKYFEKFVNGPARKLRVPRVVPVMPWEDLVEH